MMEIIQIRTNKKNAVVLRAGKVQRTKEFTLLNQFHIPRQLESCFLDKKIYLKKFCKNIYILYL